MADADRYQMVGTKAGSRLGERPLCLETWQAEAHRGHPPLWGWKREHLAFLVAHTWRRHTLVAVIRWYMGRHHTAKQRGGRLQERTRLILAPPLGCLGPLREAGVAEVAADTAVAAAGKEDAGSERKQRLPRQERRGNCEGCTSPWAANRYQHRMSRWAFKVG